MMKAEESDDLSLWLDQISFSKPRKGNLARDFSDGVMMAELLKFFYPRMVELHNYTPASCLTHKRNNWSTLNRKILSKLGLKLKRDQIEQIASATPEAIDTILLSLKQKVLAAQAKREEDYRRKQAAEKQPQNILCFVQNKNQAEAVFGVPMACETATGQQLIVSMENMVPQRLLDEKLNEMAEKDDAITILIQKVAHLDTLIQLKDQQIKDLTWQLQSLQERTKELSKPSFHSLSLDS